MEGARLVYVSSHHQHADDPLRYMCENLYSTSVCLARSLARARERSLLPLSLSLSHPPPFLPLWRLVAGMILAGLGLGIVSRACFLIAFHNRLFRLWLQLLAAEWRGLLSAQGRSMRMCRWCWQVVGAPVESGLWGGGETWGEGREAGGI